VKKGEGGGGGITVIRRKKKGHAAHHGGAWKVAYADFITALMCLFLVLWLLAMMSIQAKKEVGEYFKSHSIFKGTREGGGRGVSFLPGSKSFVTTSDLENEVNANRKKVRKARMEEQEREKIRKIIGKKISKIVGLELGKRAASTGKKSTDTKELTKEENIDNEYGTGFKEQVLIFTSREGVRVELVEKSGSQMFESGSAKMIVSGKEILKAVATALRDIPNSISIEGHTDAFNFPFEEYTNWELSADRANSARRELIKNGINPSRVAKVTSFADTLPFKDDKYNPVNRRVTILVHDK
jgi:chemotaxis protein MotB